MRPLSNELQKVAKEELNEDVNRTREDIRHIKEWLKKQPHLKARTDDQWLLTFLRGCKFSLERTKEKLDFYYTARGLCPELFSKRDPFLPEIQEILKIGLFLPLPKVAGPASPRIIILRNMSHENIKLTNIFKTNLMLLDILLNEDDNVNIAGSIVIQDMTGATLSYMATTPLDVIKKFMTTVQHGYPFRPKAMYFIHIPGFFESIMTVFRPFLTEKIKKRVRIYEETEMDDLYNEVPRSLLPKEYGGDTGTIAEIAAEWKKKVESYSDWFKEEEKYGSDEKKRPGKPKTSDEMFGVEGSFRKLAVD